MASFSISADSGDCGFSELRDCGRRYFDLGALFKRVERFEARRQGGRSGAVTATPRHWDGKLLQESEDFEAAWAHEIATLIAMKRLNTPEAGEAARSARAATARIAARIEAARAITLDGLKVKARAILWRRNGEPLGTIGPSERAPDDAQGRAAGVADPVSV